MYKTYMYIYILFYEKFFTGLSCNKLCVFLDLLLDVSDSNRLIIDNAQWLFRFQQLIIHNAFHISSNSQQDLISVNVAFMNQCRW